MTSRFMGFDKDMTLLEADGKLKGLINDSSGKIERTETPPYEKHQINSESPIFDLNEPTK